MANGPASSHGAEPGRQEPQLDVGQLAVVNNQADPGSGTIQLKAVFPNQQRKLWPGTFVNVRLVIANRAQCRSRFPLDAIQQGPQGSFVFVVGQDNKGNGTAGPRFARRSGAEAPRRERIERC